MAAYIHSRGHANGHLLGPPPGGYYGQQQYPQQGGYGPGYGQQPYGPQGGYYGNQQGGYYDNRSTYYPFKPVRLLEFVVFILIIYR